MCRDGAFENPLFSMGASHPGFGSHSKAGLQAPNVCWLPAGTPSVLQKDRQVTNTAEVMKAAIGFHLQFIISTGRGQASEPRRIPLAGSPNDLLPFFAVWYESTPFSGFIPESGGEDKND
jgi:hypothetical protein